MDQKQSLALHSPPANIADVSLLVLEMLVESVTFETGMSSEAGAADFAIQRRFRVVNSGDVIPQLAVGSGAERAGVDEAVIGLHVEEGIPELDLLLANATRLKRRHLREDLRQTALPCRMSAGKGLSSLLLINQRSIRQERIVNAFLPIPQTPRVGWGIPAEQKTRKIRLSAGRTRLPKGKLSLHGATAKLRPSYPTSIRPVTPKLTSEPVTCK